MDKEYKNNMTLKGKIKWFNHEKGQGGIFYWQRPNRQRNKKG